MRAVTFGAQARRRTTDWLPSVVLAVVAGHELLYNDSRPIDWVLAQALVWLLVVRRLAPELVLALTLTLAAAAWSMHTLLVAHLGVLVALHAVAAQRSRGRSLVAAGIVEAAATVVAVQFSPAGSVNDGLVLLTGLTMSALLLGTTQRAQRQYLTALEERAEQLETERNIKAQMAAVEERTRIAREIHDIVAHSVSVMIALSEGAAATPDDGQARSSMRQVAATGREALGELRRVLSVLRSSPARQGGGHHQEADRDPQPTLASLEKLADDVRAAGLSVHLDVDGDVGQLPDAMQATVFRVVQEAFTNTLKHGRDVHRSDVVVEVGPEQVRVVIRDDGRPSDVREAARSVPAGSAIGSSGSGSGLRGMRERAEMFGGSVATRALPTGWEVVCLLDRRARGVS